VRKFTSYHLIFYLFFILALSIALPSIASAETSFSLDGEMTLKKTVDSTSPKPGDKVNFTITYSNDLHETAYNVTIFEWMPPNLTFISSKPFYDGVSDPETGFYRWSRGNIPLHESGTVIVKAMVDNVPVETVITNTAHLAYEFENGTRVEVTSSVNITVMQAAGVDVYPDQIHSVPPHTGAWTEFNVTVENTGNGLDTFNISLRSIAYNPSGSTHEWKIELYNSTGYPKNLVATVYDDNVDNPTSWTDHGVLTSVTLASGESTWFMIKVTEAEGTSGSGDAYLDVHLIATSLFDPSVSELVDKMTIVKSVAGITLGPDYSKYANPGDLVVYRHIVVNSGQTEVVDLKYTSPRGWNYSFCFDNGTVLTDTDGSGYVDIGVLPKNGHVYILVKVNVPYGTAAGITDPAVITATGVTSGNYDTANDTITVKSTPILGVEKKLVSDNPTYVGDVVTYWAYITNLGNTRLTKIPLDDAFETLSLNFSSADPAEDAYDETAGTIHWENLTTLEPKQSMVVTVNFVATAGDDIVRQSANVIDAEDEFGNLISATSVNTELKIIGFHTLTVTASPTGVVGGSFSVTWTERGVLKDGTFTTQKDITCDQDTTAEVSYPESPITKGDVRYVFTDYSPSATVTMDSDKTVTLNYRTEYTLTFQQIGSHEPVYITINGTQLPEALPQSFWVCKGSTTTFSYSSPVTDTASTTRYVLTEVSGNTTDTTVTVNAPTNVTGFYKTQYYLNVTTDPMGLDAPQYSGWYDKEAYANLEVETPTGGDGVSTRYRFDHWTGIGIANTTSPLTQIFMDAPKTATAHYVKQFKFTVASDHDSPVPSAGDYWIDEDDSITASVTSPADESDGTRYRCTGWTGTGSVPATGTDLSVTFTMTAPSTIIWEWIPQYQITFTESGLEPGRSVAITVNGEPHSGTATYDYSEWFDEGLSITFSITDQIDSTTSGKRYVLVNWKNGAGSVITSAQIISAPDTFTAHYKTQYQLTIDNGGHGITTPTSGNWYDAGEWVTIMMSSDTTSNSTGTRYLFALWSGSGTGSYSGPATPCQVQMNGPITETASWKTQYYLTVISLYGTPGGAGWYDSDSTAYATLDTEIVSAGSGIRYVFTKWGEDASGTDFTQSDPIIMNAPKTANADWKTQYYLTVNTDPIDLDDPTGEGWYDEGTYAAISVDTPTGGDGVSTRYRFHNWTGRGIVDAATASTTILMDARKVAEAVFIEQFYLTTSTNFGVVSPDSRWYDAGSIVSIEATAPAVAEGKGYVWHGWTGTGEGSYSGIENPATVTMNSAISENAYWKIDPLLTIMILNHTIASGDEIVVSGKMLPAQSGVEILVTYTFPNGTQIEHTVYTNDKGEYEDALLLDQGYPYSLFVDDGEWVITASRPSDISYETTQTSTTLKIEAPPIVQFHPALLAGLIIAIALVAYALIIKKVKSNSAWWRATVILSCAGLIFGAVSLALNWVLVTGTATTDNATYQVDVLLYPLSNGLVSITGGIRYVGAKMPSMVDPTWQNIIGSSSPVWTLYLVPVGCAIALAGLYKPKNARQRDLKVAILVISGVLIVTSVVHALIFVQGQVSTIDGAAIGYGIGVYTAIISGTLTVLSGLFAARETHIKPMRARTDQMSVTEPLPRSFYARDTAVVAKDLLHKHLVRRTSEGDIVAKIVEVEAYKGAEDPASHAYKGLTERNWPMFGKPGCAYIYFIYGNHHCLNVTTEREGVPGAVLIRAVEIVDGLELARKNRKADSLVDLSNGPSKLTEALNISEIYNGLDLTERNELFICPSETIESFETTTSRRIGVKAGSEKPWRFYIKNNKFVSKP